MAFLYNCEYPRNPPPRSSMGVFSTITMFFSLQNNIFCSPSLPFLCVYFIFNWYYRGGSKRTAWVTDQAPFSLSFSPFSQGPWEQARITQEWKPKIVFFFLWPFAPLGSRVVCSNSCRVVSLSCQSDCMRVELTSMYLLVVLPFPPYN